MIPTTLVYLLLVFSAFGLFVCFVSAGIFLAQRTRQKYLFPIGLWRQWRQQLDKTADEPWDSLLGRAGYPFHFGKAEWLAVQCILGVVMFLLLIIWQISHPDHSLSLIWLCLLPSLAFFAPYWFLRWWADYREEMLSTDIARFINRYVTLLENQVPPYVAMVKAARPTKKLKHCLPSLSEWNKDRYEALEKLKQILGTDDGMILVSNMRTIEQLPSDLVSVTLNRLEWVVDQRRRFRQRKKIKSLGLAYSLIVYPAFYIGLIVAMFPWYKLLTEILDKYLV
ncbi:hypothetical protein [Brevibacillus dissolubilis]|uniref:hypothetical protein n=1 Tax=Brevibacillus dissolubilis TaxID=1844116 RepID=UPI001116EE1B|nr:hypothetical protein [Brevibacillus dissolubilis]